MTEFIEHCSQCGHLIPEERKITIKGKEDWCYTCYKAGPKTVCVDFDGVLAQYDGWKGPGHMGEPMPGAKGFLEILNAEGYQVVIYSTRSAENIYRWLKLHDLDRYIYLIADYKVAAVAYIDDRNIVFRGRFSDALADLKDFKPYWKKGG